MFEAKEEKEREKEEEQKEGEEGEEGERLGEKEVKYFPGKPILIRGLAKFLAARSMEGNEKFRLGYGLVHYKYRTDLSARMLVFTHDFTPAVKVYNTLARFVTSEGFVLCSSR